MGMGIGGSILPGRASGQRMLAAVALAGVLAVPDGEAAAQGAPPAWRVECAGDGKTLECLAVQTLFRDRQIVIQVTVRYVAETKAAAMAILLPLGLNLTEPVLIKVDSGQPEKQPIQTCDAGGCRVSMTASDKLLAAMRTGNELKVTVQDASKKPVDISLPLLGFGIAYDKTK
jgi:invasion protein IalB